MLTVLGINLGDNPAANNVVATQHIKTGTGIDLIQHIRGMGQKAISIPYRPQKQFRSLRIFVRQAHP